MAPTAVFTATDTCARCGLRRLTKRLEEKGAGIRLCDDCFWGQEPGEPAENEPAAALGPTDVSRILWGPLDDLSTLRESVDVLLEVPYACRWHGRALATKQPAVDLFETAHDLIVRTELSGIDARDVEIRVTDKILTIKSRRFYDRKPRQEAFTRSLTLPYAVKGDQIKASYRYGILEIRMPKDRLSKSRVTVEDLAS